MNDEKSQKYLLSIASTHDDHSSLENNLAIPNTQYSFLNNTNTYLILRYTPLRTSNIATKDWI